MGMLAGVTECSRSRKWGCRGRLALGFKPRLGSHTWKGTTQLWWRREDHAVLKEKGEDHAVLRGEGRENHAALAEWGPRGGHTGNGARSLNHRLLLLFLRHGTPDWAQGEGRSVHLWVF